MALKRCTSTEHLWNRKLVSLTSPVFSDIFLPKSHSSWRADVLNTPSVSYYYYYYYCYYYECSVERYSCTLVLTLHFCSRSRRWEVNIEDYWELISFWFTPDLRLNNCRPSVCWPVDRRCRVAGRRTSKMSRPWSRRPPRSDARRQILSDGANARPSTAKVGLIASVSWTAAGSCGTDRCQSAGTATDRPTAVDSDRTAHLSLSTDARRPHTHATFHLLSQQPTCSLFVFLF